MSPPPYRVTTFFRRCLLGAFLSKILTKIKVLDGTLQYCVARSQRPTTTTSILRPCRPQLYVHVDLNYTSIVTQRSAVEKYFGRKVLGGAISAVTTENPQKQWIVVIKFKVRAFHKSSKQMKNLIFAFNICRYVKSNAIVLASNETTTGIGSGQPSRLDSCHIAIDKMKKFMNTHDEVVAASDAFFPFVDGIEKLVQSGVRAVIQPSGSIRDKEIINFANETDTILVFSKTRHFRH